MTDSNTPREEVLTLQQYLTTESLHREETIKELENVELRSELADLLVIEQIIECFYVGDIIEDVIAFSQKRRDKTLREGA